MVAKDSTHESLYQTVDELDCEDKVMRYEYTDDKGFTHGFRFVNGVPINKSHPDVLVNYLEYIEIDPEGNRKYVNTWVTDIELSTENVNKFMGGARAKWIIENDTFNTLKTQGYHLEHNYGHEAASGQQSGIPDFYGLPNQPDRAAVTALSGSTQGKEV